MQINKFPFNCFGEDISGFRSLNNTLNVYFQVVGVLLDHLRGNKLSTMLYAKDQRLKNK